MTAKQYLRQAYRLNQKIDADMSEKKRLHDRYISIRVQDLSSERVQSSPNNDGKVDTLAKIMELEAKINTEIDRYVALKEEIRESINKVEDDTLKLILQKRYLNFEKWEKIAVDMDYSTRRILQLHNKALSEVENIALNFTKKI